MRPRTTSNQRSLCIARFACLLVYLGFGSIAAFAAAESKVVTRENIQQNQREVLAGKLREITGWRDLRFDPNGFLQLGLRESSKGSPTARELLTKAVMGPSLIVLEDASSRSDVVFSRVVQARWLRHSVSVQAVFIVLIDFADFEKVMGDRLALASFDVGWVFLHEVDHVVKDSHDPSVETTAGECEDSINQMRREVGLPLRMDYFFSSMPFTPDPQFVSRFVRMRFEQLQKPNKVKRYWLIWDAAIVGGLQDARLTSSL